MIKEFNKYIGEANENDPYDGGPYGEEDWEINESMDVIDEFIPGDLREEFTPKIKKRIKIIIDKMKVMDFSKIHTLDDMYIEAISKKVLRNKVSFISCRGVEMVKRIQRVAFNPLGLLSFGYDGNNSTCVNELEPIKILKSINNNPNPEIDPFDEEFWDE